MVDMKTHHFDDTGYAYDACQTDENIKTGDILICERDQVIGIADVWPVAITIKNGELHTVDPKYIQDWMKDRGITKNSIITAIKIALSKYWPVNPMFLDFK